ncbi:MAG: hypothetical protein BAJALOKI1v1_1340013 [Promethearchaeota archaeon]|nr:MAG: hypothetical protein BAJALOKI1v1_1340013 [Candidatus Lokiarchaeota archaeon]
MSEIIAFLVGGAIFFIFSFIVFYLVMVLLKNIRKKYVPKRATIFKCLDGHITRSKGELIIDNHLTRLDIEHEYENTVRVRGKAIKYDWYLPEYNVYIEYWGYFGKDYLERKEEKLKLYKKGHLKLISIEDIMLEDIYQSLESQLSEFIPSEKLKKDEKHCPNCGELLDSRFL